MYSGVLRKFLLKERGKKQHIGRYGRFLVEDYWMRIFRSFIALPVLFSFQLGAQPVCASEPAVLSFDQQVEKYIQDFPYQETHKYLKMYTRGNSAALNHWLQGSEPKLIKAGEDLIVRSNNDTFYKAAFIYLEDGPVVLNVEAPSDGRFSSIQLIDDRNVNYRNLIHPSGRYTIYYGEEPDNIVGEAILAPSKLGLVLVRVEVKNIKNESDVAAAATIFRGITLIAKPVTKFPQLDLSGGYSAEVAAEAQRQIDQTVDTTSFTDLIVGPGQQPGREVSFLEHAAGTKVGWGGPDPAHSAYDMIRLDDAGEPMLGSQGPYELTTAEPPVNAFWSISVYDTDRGGFLHPNKDDKYHINNTTAVKNLDGTVTFTFRQICTATDINCLEVPAGRFDLAARYYLPKQDIILGNWRMPRAARRH
jgi:hypothetical protein